MKNTTAETFTADVIENERVTLVRFTADWCGPCKALAPIVEAIDSEQDGLDVFVVDIDAEPELAERFQITSIPVMKIFKGGSAVKTIIGAKPKPALEHELSAYLG